MMYLCKISLDPRHAQGRRDLGDPYEMHSTLSRAIAPDENTAPPRFLWRLERVEPDAAVLLIQTPIAPDWQRVEARTPGYVLGAEVREFDYATLLQADMRCRFRLLANPTVTRAGKRYGLQSEEDQLDWLSRQGERGGFMVLGCMRTESRLLRARQRKADGNRITVQAAGFEGLLKIKDAESFARILEAGLGHAKSLGLGLLSVARAGA